MRTRLTDRAPVLLLALAACQPWNRGDTGDCISRRPPRGAIQVEEVRCTAQIPPFGEGRDLADIYIANNDYRVVLRHPQDALSIRGLGGLTIVDAAPWGMVDRVNEVIPSIGGGWLEIVDVSVGDGWVEGTGVVTAWPESVAVDEGLERTVRYVPDPDGPWLTVEGADGFWIHPRGDEERLDGFAFAEGAMVGTAGTVTDFGGAFRVDGTNRLLIARDTTGWAALASRDPIQLRGTAPEATSLSFLRGGEVVGRSTVTAGAFDLTVPDTIDAVRAEARGRTPSPAVAPGIELNLPLGAAGSLTLLPVWADGRDHGLSVDVNGARHALSPGGGTLELGPGVFDLVLSAGPLFEPAALHVEIDDDEHAELGVRLPLIFDPGNWVLAGFGWPSDRSQDWRGSDALSANLAVASGYSFVVFASEEDVSDVVDLALGFPRLAFRNGSERTTDGGTLQAWPWTSSARKTLHGGLRPSGLSLLDVLAAMEGGPDDRSARADLPFLAAAGPPNAVVPSPTHVALAHPAASSWAPWLAWLDAGRPVIPTGPATWVPVYDPARMSAIDVEQGLNRGNVVAGDGPLLLLTVDGFVPGDLVVASASTGDTGADPTHTVTAELRGGEDVDRLELWGDGGRLIASFDALAGPATIELTLTDRFVLLAATSDDPSGPWAVTGPVWLNPTGSR